MIKSNLRWPGGKSRIIKNIIPYFPDHIDKYYEMFIGGASVGLWIIQSYNLQEIIWNDINYNLINYYKNIKSEYRDQIEGSLLEIKKTYNSDSFRKIFYDANNRIINSSVRFFVLNKTRFSGVENGGYSKEAYNKRFTEKAIYNIKKIGNYINIRNVKLENNSFEKCSIIGQSGYFIYCDPPYYANASKGLYGKKGELHKNFDHEKFFNVVSELSNNNQIMISYDNCEWIKEKYKDWRIIEFEEKYPMTNPHGGSCKIGKELLILNYD